MCVFVFVRETGKRGEKKNRVAREIVADILSLQALPSMFKSPTLSAFEIRTIRNETRRVIRQAPAQVGSHKCS